MTLSMLEYLSDKLKCAHLSDLRFLKADKLVSLIQTLKEIPIEKADLHEWNETLRYLTGEAPCETRTDTKQLMIKMLENYCQ